MDAGFLFPIHIGIELLVTLSMLGSLAIVDIWCHHILVTMKFY